MTQDSITVIVPKKANLVFQVQNIADTNAWAVVEKGDLLEIVEKARLYDLESHDRLAYEAEKISRDLALANPISLGEMIAADRNSKLPKAIRPDETPTGLSLRKRIIRSRGREIL